MKKIIIAAGIKALLEKEQSFLNRKDITIFTATDNAKAIEIHRTERADLIIAELDDPGMSGEILTSLIRDDAEMCKASIIIVCSDTESDMRRCLQCDANAFVTRPVNNASLLQEVYHLLHVAPRKSLRVPLSIMIQASAEGKPFIAYAENISVSGMLLHTETLLCEGDEIVCSFYLPDSTHITTNAEVVRTLDKETEHDTNAYGIKFIDIGAVSYSAIRAFVEKGDSTKNL